MAGLKTEYRIILLINTYLILKNITRKETDVFREEFKTHSSEQASHKAGAALPPLLTSIAGGHDGTGRDGTGHDGTGRDGTRRDGTGHDGTGHDRTGRDGTGRANWPVAGSARPGLPAPQSGFSTFLTLSHVTWDTGPKVSLPSRVGPITTTQIKDR